MASINRRAVLVGLLLALAALPGALTLDHRLAGPGPVAGTESAAADRAVATRFDSPVANVAVLVLSGLPRLRDSTAWRALVRQLLAPLARQPDVTAIISAGTSLDTLLVGRDGTTALALIGLRDATPAVLQRLRGAGAGIVDANRDTIPRLTLHWTGQLPLIDDLRTTGIAAAHDAELRALPLTLVAALWAIGPAGALLALLVAALVIVIAFGAVSYASPWIAPTLPVRFMVPLFGLALSVDYVLYLHRRTREGAARAPLRATIRLAALVVALAFLALMLAPGRELRALAPGGVLVAGLAALIATALVPERVNGLPAPPPRTRWRRWGSFVVRHPWVVLAATALPLGFLAWRATGARLVTPLGHWLPAGMESARAVDELHRAGRAGVVGALRLVVTLPSNVPILDEPGWKMLQEAQERVRQVPGVAVVRSLASIGTGSRVVAAQVLPEAVRNSYISRDGRMTVLDVIPDLARGDTAATALVERLRAGGADALFGVPGGTLAISGLPAYVVDYAGAIRRVLPAVVAATTLATLLALIAVLRAPVLAIKAVLLNLLVASAAIGATVMVFQDGVGASWLGVTPLGAVLPTVPLLTFGAVFGLSMDYELFLLSGVLEARAEGADDTAAIVEGLARSGPLIARAAVIMGCLFLAFAVSSLVPLAMTGFALAVAVLLDATVVRLGLAPAILRIAGRWNWWPGSAGAPRVAGPGTAR